MEKRKKRGNGEKMWINFDGAAATTRNARCYGRANSCRKGRQEYNVGLATAEFQDGSGTEGVMRINYGAEVF